MNVSWLTLRDLEYVVAVAKHEHFGHAAKECRVSQPSLSTQIKKVEGYLGTLLFERNNRRVATTASGKKIAEQAAVILDEARKIPALLDQASSSQLGSIKLGVIFSASSFIPYALNEMKKAFRGVPIGLREGTTDELVRELKSGALDAVIAANTVKERSLNSIPLFFEPFVLAAPRGHAILDKSKLKQSDLRASEMVLLEEGHCLRKQALHICPTNRRGNLRSFHANSIETLRHLVASGAGYTLLPKLATKGTPMNSLISYVDFDSPRLGREMVLLLREQTADQNSFKLLTQTLIKAAPTELTSRSQAP